MKFSKKDTKVVKGIAINFMIYHHLFAFPERFPEDISYISTFSVANNTISFWIGVSCNLALMLFVFLSGYGTYISSQENYKGTIFAANKIKKLYFAFWKVFIIFIPICMALNVPQVTKDLKVFILNFTGIVTTYVHEWWFILPFVILMIIFPFVKKLLEKTSNGGLLKDLAILFIFNIVSPVPADRYMEISAVLYLIILVLHLLPVFWSGCICAKYDLLSLAKKHFGGKPLSSLASLLTIGLIFCIRYYTGLDFNYDCIYAPLFTISIIIFLQNKHFKFIYFILKKLGNESTVIWLTHSIYCYLLCPRLVFAPKYAPLIALWLCVISYLTSISITLFYKGLSKSASTVKKYICNN